MPAETLRVALIGNPNTGKSTLFNGLAGLRVRTGNYPGVTVEERIGTVRHGDRSFELIDLPGTYSLTPRSPDEEVAVNILAGAGDQERPDAVICVCDATALDRNLFLVTQVREFGIPLVICLNMSDSADRRGISINDEELARTLDAVVVRTSASRRIGLEDLKAAVLKAAETTPTDPPCIYPQVFRDECNRLEALASEHGIEASPHTRFIFERFLLSGEIPRLRALPELPEGVLTTAISEGRKRLIDAELQPDSLEAHSRYAFIREFISRNVQAPERNSSVSDKLDAVLTHRVAGLLICLGVMLFIFSTIYWWSGPLSEAVDGLLGSVAESVEGTLAPGPLRSLLVEGVIAGVGGVLVFLPQIALLFLLIGILEDCGYMSRAAFMMDRIMAAVGLSGRSFLPLMSSFACAVPGIMATRVIDNRQDRFVTMLIAPLMSCSARLPVYVLLIGAFVPETSWLGGWLSLQGLVLFCMTFLGAAIAIPIAWILKKTFFPGESSAFLMELPDYRWPSPRVVGYRVFDSCRAFVVRAGTLIFATSVIVWAAANYPSQDGARYVAERALVAAEASADVSDEEVSQLAEQLNVVQAEIIEGSILGRAGKLVEPVVAPLGWDWRIGVGAIASFPAREVIIATLGTIFSIGSDVDEEDTRLVGSLKSATRSDGTPLFDLPVALSIMVFFALCAQCISTLMVIRRETNSWRWPIFSFAYMTILAWLGALVTYQAAAVLCG